jgi:hypothetical protein
MEYQYLYKFIFNMFWGFILGLVIGYYKLKKTNYKGPNSNDIKKKIFHKSDKCYKLIPFTFICPNNEKHD